MLPQVSLRSFRRDPAQTLTDLAPRGEPASFYLGRQRVLYLSTPELIEEAFVENAGKVGKWGRVRRWWLLQPPVYVQGQYLATHDRTEHLRTRRLMQPAFRRSRAEADAPALAAHADRLLGEVITEAETEALDLYLLAGGLMIAAVSLSLFDRRLAWSEASRLARLVLDMEKGTPGSDVVSSRALTWASAAGSPRALKRMREARSLVYEEAGARLDGERRNESLPAIFSDIDEDDQRALFISMLQTSVSPAVPSLMHLMLALNDPKLRERLRNEAQVNEAADCPLRRGSVLEALRLGAGWQLSRVCHEPFGLAGVAVRRGDWLLACPYLLHRDARYWEEPETFRPERWEKELSHRYSFVAFGVSSRVCLGRDLTIAFFTALVPVLLRWELAPLEPVNWRPAVHGDLLPVVPALGYLKPPADHTAE